MKEQLISFETAKLAKVKGYNITNILSYDENTGDLLPLSPAYPGYHCYTLDGACPAPTQSLLQLWLREIHDIHVQVCICLWSIRKYQYVIHSKDVHKKSSQYLDGAIIGDYEYVLELGLQEALKLIK